MCVQNINYLTSYYKKTNSLLILSPCRLVSTGRSWPGGHHDFHPPLVPFRYQCSHRLACCILNFIHLWPFVCLCFCCRRSLSAWGLFLGYISSLHIACPKHVSLHLVTSFPSVAFIPICSHIVKFVLASHGILRILIQHLFSSSFTFIRSPLLVVHDSQPYSWLKREIWRSCAFWTPLPSVPLFSCTSSQVKRLNQFWYLVA